MFNRQPFNRGKFNRQVEGGSLPMGLGRMELGAKPVTANVILYTEKTTADIKMKSSSIATNVLLLRPVKSHMELLSKGNATNMIFGTKSSAEMTMYSTAIQLLAGEEVIKLEGLDLKPGDKLVINTCDMTVTINGGNAIRYITRESYFFDLYNGENRIVYSDSENNRDVSFDIIWKDKWL